MIRVVVVASLLIALTGCVHRVECSTHGGPEWRELQTTHFRVRTDLPADRAEAASLRLEALVGALAKLLPGSAVPPMRADLILLASESELVEFTPNYSGFAAPNEEGIFGVMTDPESNVPTHELAHAVVAYALPRVPRWLTEGLAVYSETLELHDGTATWGAQPEILGWAARHEYPLSFEDLWKWNESTAQDELWHYYMSAWAYVYLLINDHPTEYAAFINGMMQGAEPRAAWAKSVSPELQRKLENESQTRLREGGFETKTEPVTAAGKVVRTDAFPPAGVHLLRAELWGSTVTQKDVNQRLVRSEAEAAMKLPGNELPALQLLAILADQKDKPATLTAVQKFVDAHPSDALGWRYLGEFKAEKDLAAAIAAYRRAVELDETSPQALNGLAWWLARNGRAAEAVPFARRAAATAPWSANIADTLAVVLSLSGSCTDAAAEEERAISLLTDKAVQSRKRFQDRLASFQSGCKAELSRVMQ